MQTRRGLLCGFQFRLGGNSGVKGLHASEGYCRPAGDLTDPACSVIHALRDLYLLQLEQIPTDLFILPPDILELCRGLVAGEEPAAPLHRLLREMLIGVEQRTLQPCVKGRFFDAMTAKLDQLQRGRSNEVTTVDFAEIVTNVLLDPS